MINTYDTGNIPILSKIQNFSDTENIKQETERLIIAYNSFKKSKKNRNDRQVEEKLDNFFSNFNAHISILIKENKELKNIIKELCHLQANRNLTEIQSNISESNFNSKEVKYLNVGVHSAFSNSKEKKKFSLNQNQEKNFLSVKIQKMSEDHKDEMKKTKEKYEKFIKEQDMIIRDFRVRKKIKPNLGKIQRVREA